MSDRACADAIFYVLRTGCQWHALDQTELCAHSTAHSWLNRFRRLLVRWDKKPQNYLAFVHFGRGLIALRAGGLGVGLSSQPRPSSSVMKGRAAMAGLLVRYLQGECEQVWDELLAMGDQVRAEALYADALAVARETMRRARSNLETLLPRLQMLGYKFGYDWLTTDEQERNVGEVVPPLFAPPGPDVQARLAELERLAEGIPLSLRAWYEAVGAVNFVGIPPFHWPLPPWREGLKQYFAARPDTPEWIVTEQWREAEASYAAFSAACRQFIEAHPQYPQYTREELWHFAEAHPGFLSQLPHVCTWLDPLQVWSLEDQFRNEKLTMYQEWEARYGEAPDFPRSIILAGDNLFKYQISGGAPYEIVVPCRAADAPLEGEPHKTTFVTYLRLCFRWGGLPGLGDYPNPPQQDLAYLTTDLLPI